MDQRLNLVTLGVVNLQRAVRFYREGLGWRMWSGSDGDFALFLLAGGVGLALYPRSLLAQDSGAHDRGGFGGITLAQNVADRAEVDRVLGKAVSAGGSLLKAATDKEWGGYSGHFADLDGHPWEVAWNPHFKMQGGLLALELQGKRGVAGSAPGEL